MQEPTVEAYSQQATLLYVCRITIIVRLRNKAKQFDAKQDDTLQFETQCCK